MMGHSRLAAAGDRFEEHDNRFRPPGSHYPTLGTIDQS